MLTLDQRNEAIGYEAYLGVVMYRRGPRLMNLLDGIHE
jgi:hypothetical protein